MAILYNPNYGELAYFSRAVAKDHFKDYTAAIANFTKAIEIKPDYKEAYYYRGLIKYKIQDIEGALSDAKKAIELGYKNSENHSE
jgi:tetratricopeptide (TPR) repeat protein